jgi:hypothetical protein
MAFPVRHGAAIIVGDKRPLRDNKGRHAGARRFGQHMPLRDYPLLIASKPDFKFLFIARFYRKTVSHFSGRTLAKHPGSFAREIGFKKDYLFTYAVLGLDRGQAVGGQERQFIEHTFDKIGDLVLTRIEINVLAVESGS